MFHLIWSLIGTQLSNMQMLIQINTMLNAEPVILTQFNLTSLDSISIQFPFHFYLNCKLITRRLTH